MFAKIITKPFTAPVSRQIVARRGFSSTSSKLSAHFEDGVYTNIPFKVHNRRIPYLVPHFLFFLIGMGLPFFACYVQLKRSGSL